jgi:hypothetical protein
VGGISTALGLLKVAIRDSPSLTADVKAGLTQQIDRIEPSVDALEEAVQNPDFNDLARALAAGALGEALAVARLAPVMPMLIAGLAELAAISPILPGLLAAAIVLGIGWGLGELIDWTFDRIGQELGDLLRHILGDPIVLDLDGDGIELVALAGSATHFNIDNDGIDERTGWVSPHDGILVHDIDQDGALDGIGELFGDMNTDGYDVLAMLDSNSDDRIDASDTAFADLLVWRDLNGDGEATADEMLTLAQAGIAANDNGLLRKTAA